MIKRLCVIAGLLLCAGCAQSNPSAAVSVPKAELFDSVTRTVYPQDQSVLGDVYEPVDQPRILVPPLPGEPAPEQSKPPLLNTN
ncbi:hypothetical protein GZH47_05330 [Paenibacillus rhizovicinus]|uniref:Uncharacterized protein n=1 Tax=Paenibacillus rhizovicinus TaxID=2704463 RepID=A0A6C0NX73_9BACL|nr:hypothetical protein [Paenibacillus rhizovicinus]QHW30323.1 hypothetical protein GZH47_05330 [Paenibacillus rhizovicinus]